LTGLAGSHDVWLDHYASAVVKDGTGGNIRVKEQIHVGTLRLRVL